MDQSVTTHPGVSWLQPLQLFARTWLETLPRREEGSLRHLVLFWVALIGMPLFYVVWAYAFPQPYENLGLRLVGSLLAVPALFLRQRIATHWLGIYLFVGLAYELPFFFTFMFLMNGTSPVWTQSLLLALILLFHFPTRAAILAYVLGTAAAVLSVHALRPDLDLGDPAILMQLPIHLFALVTISLAKASRQVLEQEKLAGMAQALATISHELRTPLASVDASTRGLGRELQHPALERIQFEVRHMNQLIELFLLSAAALKRRPVGTERVAMTQAIASMLERYPFTTDEQRSKVSIDIRHPLVVDAQFEQCVVVLLNLLRNAFKAIRRAGKGRVRVIVEARRVLFIDTGCGIAAADLPHVFERFTSFPNGSGAGIGLALCHDIMRAWRARIRCVSRAGAYTILILEFPESACSTSP